MRNTNSNKQASVTQKDANDHKGQRAPVIDRPMLDFNTKMMLQGKKDKVNGLFSIVVEFFPNNGIEVKYKVQKNDDTEPQMLTVSEFNAWLNMKKKESSKEHEENAAKGFVAKLYKRTFVKLGDDVSQEKVRAVQAMLFPSVISKMMGKTQKEMTLAKFNEPSMILNYWNRLNVEQKEAMNKFQREVDDSYTWTETLAAETEDFEQKSAAAARKKAARQVGNSPPNDEFSRLALEISKVEAEEEDDKVGPGKAKAPTVPPPKPPPAKSDAGSVKADPGKQAKAAAPGSGGVPPVGT